MYPLNEEELLSEVSEYLLQREDICVKICLHRIIGGETKQKEFQAIPTGPDGIAPKEYCGFGDSSQEALKQCLERIKNIEKDTFLDWFHKRLYPEE